MKCKRKKRKRGRPKGSTRRRKRLLNLEEVAPEKVELIKEIGKLQPDIIASEMDLTKYSIEELKKHIRLVKERRLL